MYSYITLAVFALTSLVAAAPLPSPDGALGGVVDAVAPITAGLGVTLNQLLGFSDSPSGSGGQGGGSSGGNSSGGGQGGNSSGSGQGGNSSGSGQGGNSSGSGQGGNASGSSGQGSNASGGSGQSGSGQSGSSSGVLGGVVDAIAPITAGVGTTVNNLAGFH
ncbi:hypothetical protein IWW37_003499 [Coemansia sp. RSA 2050]|nr:hypothetical protein IWW37_003499 [Coemansia sp. RSA 2050]